MSAYYNDNDPFAATWLRELIKADLIAPGEVDERSIEDVQANDLRGFTQCHFFAGIGVWSYALRNAEWSDDSPVWTGSCPCQGFSASGKRGGFSDKRHLWPTWFRLIEECRPVTIFGEQVASKDGLAWLDVVSADLEGEDYAIGAADLCAAGFGAPHIRQRLYFVGDARCRTGEWNAGSVLGEETKVSGENGSEHGNCSDGLADASATNELDNPERTRLERFSGNGNDRDEPGRIGAHTIRSTTTPGSAIQLAHAKRNGGRTNESGRKPERRIADGRLGPTNGFWRNAEWLYCRDGKYRPVEPGVAPLVTGAPARVGRLRGYGNAINTEVAKGFIEAYLEVKEVAGIESKTL